MYADKATRYQIVKNHFERAVTNAKVRELLMARKGLNIIINIQTSALLPPILCIVWVVTCYVRICNLNNNVLDTHLNVC
jgi:hypothetical protein